MFAYEQDASDIHVQSGRPHAILESLERQGVEVVSAFPLAEASRLPAIPNYLLAKLCGRRYKRERRVRALRYLARQIEHRIELNRPDIVFSPSSVPLTHVKSHVPLAFCADATFENMVDFYPQFSGLDRKYIAEGHAQEAQMLRQCAAAIYPSQWAVDSALRRYHAQSDKVHLIPFGANISPPASDVVLNAIRARSPDQLRLIFIGREWLRKGGVEAVHVTEALRKRGLDATLDVIGPKDLSESYPDFVRFHGFLDRSAETQMSFFEGLLTKSHFLISLASAEANARAVCDGYGFGVPAVTYRVGGMASAVTDGENGLLFGYPSSIKSISDRIAAVFSCQVDYLNMAYRARRSYELTYNWDTFTGRLLGVLDCAIRGA